MVLRAFALISAVCISGPALAQAAPHPAAPPATSPAVPAPPKPGTSEDRGALTTAAAVAALDDTDDPPTYSQGDPRWKNFQLAHGVSVGKAGCLVVSLFTSLLQMGYNFDLLSFLRTLADNDLFDRFGRLRWDIQKAIPGLSAERLKLAGTAALAAAKERIADGSRVILEVVTSRGTHHWIAVVKMVGDSIIVSDPNGGKIGTLSDLYGGARAVTGLSVLTQH